MKERTCICGNCLRSRLTEGIRDVQYLIDMRARWSRVGDEHEAAWLDPAIKVLQAENRLHARMLKFSVVSAHVLQGGTLRAVLAH